MQKAPQNRKIMGTAIKHGYICFIS